MTRLGRGRRMAPRRAPAALAAGLLAVAASVLTGCTSPSAQFDQAVGQGISAVETARLAVALELDDRTFPTVTGTALEDARRELVDASTAVAETDATSASDAALRADLLDALALGVDAVNEALDAMAGIGTLEGVEPTLEEAADALDEAADALDDLGATGGDR
jgi:hypothetical protein